MGTIVCGIDPGLGVTGYAVMALDDPITPNPSNLEILDAGLCTIRKDLSLPDRLRALEEDISRVFAEHRPTVVAVEQLYSHYQHPRTAILMGHARGVILLAAARANVEVRSYSATQIKRFLTGNGRASKAQVQRAIQMTLGLPTIPEPADVADALAIALCCASDLALNQRSGVGSSRAKNRESNKSRLDRGKSP